MDVILFDSNLIDCYLNGEGDYDFLISMLGNNLTSSEFDVLAEKIGAVLYDCLEDVVSLPEELLARTLQILHATQDTKLKFSWEHCQAIMAPYLSLCTAIRHSHTLKMVYLTLNQLLHDAIFRHVIVTDQTLLPVIAEMSEQLSLVGDYESQAVIFETMIRISHNNRKYWAPIWFTDEEFVNIFIGIDGGGFERTCRYFLNILNNNMEEQRVFSFIAQSVFVDDLQMKRPPECEFWVDFNYTSASISFYCVDHEYFEDSNNANTSTTMWETVNLTPDLVKSCHLKMMPKSGLQEIITYLKYPYFENTPDSTPLEMQEKEPFIKIVFQDCFEICHHLEDIFKSLYKGQSVAMDSDIHNYALDDASQQNSEDSISDNRKSQQIMIKNTVTHAMDSDDKQHVDEQYPTSAPVAYAGQVNFPDNPSSQLTPLTSMVPPQTAMNDDPNQQSSQNALNSKDALTGPHAMDNLFAGSTSQRDHQLVKENVVSHSFDYDDLQAINQEKSNAFDGNGSMEARILQTRIKKEITSSSKLEVTTLNDSGIQTIYNIKEVSQSFVSLSPKVMNLAEMCKEAEEGEAVPRKPITANSVLEITGEKNCTAKFKKNPPLKGKIMRGKINPKLKFGKSPDIEILSPNTSNPTKRKRAIVSNKTIKTISHVEKEQNEKALDSQSSLDMPRVLNLSSVSLKNKSGHKTAASLNKGKISNKKNATTKGSTKIQKVCHNGYQNTSPMQVEDVANSEISYPKEIIEPEDKTVRQDTLVKKLARNANSKSALHRKSQVNKNVMSNPLSVKKSSVSLHGKNKVGNNVPSNPLNVIKSNTLLYEGSKVDSNVTSTHPSMTNPNILLRKKMNQNNHNSHSHMFASVKSRQMKLWRNQDNVPKCPLIESAITSHETTDNTKKSNSKCLVESDSPLLESDPPLLKSDLPLVESDLPLLESDPSLVESDLPLLESDPPVLESDSPLLESDPTSLAMENHNDNTRLNPSHMSTSTIPLGAKKLSNKDRINLNQAKFSKQLGHKRISLYNPNSEKRVDFSPIKMDRNVNEVNVAIGKDAKFNTKESKNILAKKKRQPRVKTKKLPLKNEESNTDIHLSPSTSKNQGRQVPEIEEHESVDYELYRTPRDISKGEIPIIMVVTPEKKVSTDDDIQMDLSTVKEAGISMAAREKVSDDNGSDFNEPKPSKKAKVKKTNRKAAVSSMKRTKKILQPVKRNIGTDSSSIVELQPVGPSTKEVYKTSNEIVKTNEDSDSDDCLKGNTCPSFEIPLKTYKTWTPKNQKMPETQTTIKKKQNANASAVIENIDSHHWSNIDNFSLTFEGKKRKTPLRNLEATDINVVSKSKSNRENSAKSLPGPSIFHKDKKAPKPGSPLASHYKDLKVVPKVPEPHKNNSAESDSSYLPHVVFSRDNVPAEESATTDAQQTEDDVSRLPLIVEKTPTAVKKIPKRSKIAMRKRTAKSTQKKQKSTATSEIEKKIAPNSLPEPSFPLIHPNDHLADCDNESTNHDNLLSDRNSKSSCAGSNKGKERLLVPGVDKISMNHLKKTGKHGRSKFIPSVPDGRKILFKRFLTDVSSVSSVPKKKKKHEMDHSRKKTSLTCKKSYNTIRQTNEFDLMIRNSTSEISDSSMHDGDVSSSRHLQNASHSLESSASSDSSLSLTPHNILPINYGGDQRLLKKFMYTAQMLTSNLYNAMISIREDYLKVLSDFDGKSQLISGNFSSMKNYQDTKTQYWLKMRKRLKHLLNALDLYRLKEKRFEDAFKLLKKHTGASYAKARYQATQEALHNYEGKLLRDLKKVMMKTSKTHRLFSHI